MMIYLKYKWQNHFYKLSLPMTEPEPWCWNSFCKAVEGLVRKFSSSCPSTCSELEFLFRGLPSPQFNTYKMIIKKKCGKKVVNYTCYKCIREKPNKGTEYVIIKNLFRARIYLSRVTITTVQYLLIKCNKCGQKDVNYT